MLRRERVSLRSLIMDAEKVVSKNLTPGQEDFLEVETHCCLCGTELVFDHEQDETAKNVRERAQRPCCNIQLKEKEFMIH